MNAYTAILEAPVQLGLLPLDADAQFRPSPVLSCDGQGRVSFVGDRYDPVADFGHYDTAWAALKVAAAIARGWRG